MAKSDTKKNNYEGWRTTRKERVSYYSGDLGRIGAQQIVTAFMTTFLMFQGLDLVSLAGFTLFVKIIDAFDDVIFGYLVDRIKLENIPILKKSVSGGKYLHWFRLTFLLLPLVVITFFAMPNGLSDASKIIWFVVTYLVFDLACTLSEVPMNSMVMTITDVVEERSVILKIKGVLMTIAAIILAVLFNFLISEHVGLTVKQVAIGSTVIFLFMMLPMAFNVKEHNTELKNTENEKEEKYSLKDMWNCLKTNKYMFLIVISTFFFAALNTASPVALFAAYYVLGDSMYALLPMIIAFIPGILLDMNADKIAKKFGRKTSMIALGFLAAAGYFSLYFMKNFPAALIIIVMAISCIPGAVRFIFLNFLIPDTIEYTRYKTGTDCSGIFYSINSFINKATGGIAQSLAFFFLGLFGWVEVNATDFADLAAQGVTQTPQAINALWIVNTIIPAIGFAFSSLPLLLYNLKDNDAVLMAKCNGGEITREECESLLSKKYK